MDYSAVVAAIAGGDPAGLTTAYDRYAAALYDYCRWMQPDPALAADALRETFAAVAASTSDLPDDTKLRSRLYAAARTACHRPASATGAGADKVADEPADSAELAEARRLARAALADLDPLEQEVVELRFRHHLTAIEAADVLEVTSSQVPDLAESARRYLEEVLGALVVVRAGPPSCPRLAALLDGRDEPLTVPTGKLAARHIGHCRECTAQRPGRLGLERLPDLLPLATLPDGLREPVLPPTADGPDHDQPAIQDSPPRPSGFRRFGALLSRDGIRADPGAATAVAAVTIWVGAAVTATVLTVSGAHPAHALATHQISVRAAASSSAAGGTPATARAPQSPSPAPEHRSAPAVASPVVSVAPAPLESVAAPAPSYPATAKASPSPSASKSASPKSASPSPAPTRRRTPTPTPTKSGSASPSPSSSRG